MYRLQQKKTPIDDKSKNPSFSSTLLDEIYRSIDEGQRYRNIGEMKFYRETTMGKKQSRPSLGEHYSTNRAFEEEDMVSQNLRRSRLLEKWMDKKVSKKVFGTEIPRKLHHIGDDDPYALFFSSTSSSSDSSTSGRGFSSSDTESMYGLRRSQASCFALPRPKSVKTSVSARFERSEKKALAVAERKHSALFYERKGVSIYDNCCHCSITDRIGRDEKGLIKSKSRALKICNNLKNLKQPISPGAKLTNFLNSLFTTGNAKKTKSTSTKSTVGGHQDVNAERKAKSLQASTCSSASSFSRSCLSKTESSSRGKFCNGVRRTVRFVDEEQGTNLMPVSVPIAWKIGRSPTKNKEEELKFPVMGTNRGVEEISREFLEGYNRHNRKNNLDEEEDADDDAASYASSDLFELDHLAGIGNGRFCEELPVYETTHVCTNRAIANGLIT